MRPYAAAVTFGLMLVPAAVIGQGPIGPEFRVNVYTTGVQVEPRIASNQTGFFVITWASDGQDGHENGVFARRYAPSGGPIEGAEFQVNVFTTGSQSQPAVALASDATALFAWRSRGQDGGGAGIYLRVFRGLFFPPEPEMLWNSSAPFFRSHPSLGANASGNFVVTWNSYRQETLSEYASGLFGRRNEGGEFGVNSFTRSQQYNNAPAVAMAADGRFVVVWKGVGPDGSYYGQYGLFARRFDPAGAPVGAEFQVNVTDVDDYSYRTYPTVASDAAGNFVVVWAGYGAPGGYGYDIVGRRYNASGVAQGGEFILNSFTAGRQAYPTIAPDASGGFVVAWEGYDYSTYIPEVYARTFDTSGPTGPQLTVGASPGSRRFPSVTSNAAGDFVVAWQGSDALDSDGIFARRFLRDIIFKDDFERGA